MSNIYIQEPPTNGKVLLETTVGDIDVELWSREAPKACRNFVQLCMEGYYNGTIFHRLVKGFIVQGGDPTGTGTGGHSIYGQPFKDEFHSRLRFARRGLLAMANSGKDDNGSQFFFTLAATPELQNKHTIFGKVSGNTIYNMIKLEEGSVDEDERPNYPHKVLKTKILSNPFDDIVPREVIKKEKTSKSKQVTGTKNFSLLSFGEEAEEAEEEDAEFSKMFTGKGKSSHDLTNDTKLSSELAVNNNEDMSTKDAEADQEEAQLTVESVREKLKKRDASKKAATSFVESSTQDKSEDDDEEYYLGKADNVEKQKKLESLKQEYKTLRKEMKKSLNDKESHKAVEEVGNGDKVTKLANENNMVREFLDEQQKYKEIKSTMKTQDREVATLAMLAKFQKKIELAKETYGSDRQIRTDGADEGKTVEEDDESKPNDSWLAQTLHYQEELVLAKDANLKDDAWFDIYDPRNPINKRRRGEASSSRSSKKLKK